MITQIALLDMLTEHASKFRTQHGFYTQQNHMHNVHHAPEQAVIDAVLTGFINYVGESLGVYYELYSSDLVSPEPFES